ncbi:glycoside hydrolase family 3 C-terminal domain-containing protein [Pullulanibacillus sp. KACC 23026]|uniref:glycoside hydrolase family 3 C-terminal domain-containing protein n=1 Tax=Pullulanibacillus sp. KACC 23026 TaxID=3028315 RepID=UPI0023B02943|nr:glycoside hydrolase family 3 C-terminal domain-containing protein [Pullulanibacillus sp. KACC 23026]WEG13544.1 glycoside hydrolase family 3 C-terminal domain-containing protein [Pullulanibacillus sp. KACC 23026]
MERDLKGLIQQMTLEEKASFASGLDFWHLQGLDRLGIPSVMVTDGPHGLRKQAEGSDHLGLFNSVPATCFPSAAGLACSWDRDLIQQVGEALGEECQAENVAVLLGPGANIKRSPLCGRNFEYFSEDPYLSSQMAANHIKGVQSKNVGTSLKHFAVNNQEHRRMTTSAEVSERALREIYLASFEGAVKESQPWTVMSSYNKVNGTFASENPRLLTEILRDEWGFEGFVVSDWGAVNERVDALKAGLDLEMPASYGVGQTKILDALQNGSLSEETLDQAVERILSIVFRFVDSKDQNAAFDKEAHHDLARQVASECMVLLKNEDSILPLDKKRPVSVIGAFATKPRYQGGGSSHVNPTKLENSLEEIEKKCAGKANVLYAKGYDLDRDQTNEELLTEAKEAAVQSDVAVLFLGLPDRYESEGYDREHLNIPANQVELIEAVYEVQKNMVVVLSNGAPIEMPWLGKVKGLLEGYLGGQGLGGAVADLLFGYANPSGKLAESFPQKLSDNPSYLFFPGEGDRVEYKEDIFVGYRYYDTKQVKPLFPFGYGLSYTNFKYSNLKVDKKEAQESDLVTVTVDVTNAGTLAGKEIVQLYVKDVISSVARPEKELKGFAKVALETGETKTVTFTLDRRAFAFYNTELKDWDVETGEFEILIGKSSQDILLSDSIKVISSRTPKLTVHRNTTIGDLLSDSVLAPVASQVLAKLNENNLLMSAADDEEGADMMAAMMKYLPLRALVGFSQGTITEEQLQEAIDQLNAAYEEEGNVSK